MLLIMGVLAALASPLEVTVDGDRITLGTVVPSVPEPWAAVDLGAAPAPMQHRLLSAQHMQAAVQAAHLLPPPVRVPQRVRVTRLGQVINATALRALILAKMQPELPAGALVRSLVVNSGVVLPAGDVGLRLTWPTPPRAGRQLVMAHLEVDGAQHSMVPTTLDLHVPRSPTTAPLISRGATVHVVLAQGNITVQHTAVAQANGNMGETISVLPDSGTRMLRGRVIDAQTVEVLP